MNLREFHLHLVCHFIAQVNNLNKLFKIFLLVSIKSWLNILVTSTTTKTQIRFRLNYKK